MHMIGFVLPNYIRYWYSMGATACTTTNGIKTELVKGTSHIVLTHLAEYKRRTELLRCYKQECLRNLATVHGLADAEPIPIKHKTRQWTSNNGINYSEEMWIIK